MLPYSRTERFDQSGVLATALAFGKPTVVSDVGGFGEVAAVGAARLVPPDDPVALHDAITRLLADPQEREGLAWGALTAAVGALLVARGGRADACALPRPGWMAAVTVVAIVFWLSVGLILYAHVGYPVLLGLLAWLRDRSPGARRRAALSPGRRAATACR